MIQPDPTKLQTKTATFFDTDSNDPQRSSFGNKTNKMWKDNFVNR